MRETSLSLALSFLAFMMTVIWGSPLIKLLRFFQGWQDHSRGRTWQPY